MILLWLAACTGDKPVIDDGLVRSELGTFTTDATGEVDVPVDVASDAISSILSCGPYGFDLTAHAVSITAPDGTVAYDGTAPGSGYLRVPATPDQLTVLLPTSPGLPLVSGTWTVRLALEREEPTTIACETIQRTGKMPAHPKMELHFIFVGTEEKIAGLNATSATANASFSAMLDQATALWAPAFATDPVSTEDFDGDPADYSTVSGMEQVGQLLRSGPESRWLSVFVVPELSGADTALLAPIGTAGLGGNSRSGLVLSVKALAEDPAALGQKLAMAGMEFLGLFPLVDGEVADPLDDTPVCEDSDGDGALSTAECAGSGAENLLWPQGGAQATELSDDQVWVVQRNPLIQ